MKMGRGVYHCINSWQRQLATFQIARDGSCAQGRRLFVCGRRSHKGKNLVSGSDEFGDQADTEKSGAARYENSHDALSLV